MTGYYYDFDGEPIEHWEWIALFWQTDRNVAVTQVGDGVEVSTVWMGITPSAGDPPLIYETMIFGGPEGTHRQWRTPNRDAALAAHDQAVALARETQALKR